MCWQTVSLFPYCFAIVAIFSDINNKAQKKTGFLLVDRSSETPIPGIADLAPVVAGPGSSRSGSRLWLPQALSPGRRLSQVHPPVIAGMNSHFFRSGFR